MGCVWDCFGDFRACNLNTSFGSSRFFQLGSRLLALVLKQKVYGTSLGVVYCSIRVFASGYVLLGGGSETSCQLGPQWRSRWQEACKRWSTSPWFCFDRWHLSQVVGLDPFMRSRSCWGRLEPRRGGVLEERWVWLKMMGGSNPLQELDHLQSMLGSRIVARHHPCKDCSYSISGLSVWGPIELQLAFWLANAWIGCLWTFNFWEVRRLGFLSKPRRKKQEKTLEVLLQMGQMFF